MICVSKAESLEQKSVVTMEGRRRGQAWLCHSSWVAGLRYIKWLQAEKIALLHMGWCPRKTAHGSTHTGARVSVGELCPGTQL